MGTNGLENSKLRAHPEECPDLWQIFHLPEECLSEECPPEECLDLVAKFSGWLVCAPSTTMGPWTMLTVRRRPTK